MNSISQQAIFNLLRKYRETGSLLDLPRRASTRKLTEPMLDILNEALDVNDELTASQARSLLMDRWPDLQVSIPTIKRARREIGWVCTRPYYCQLLRDVSCNHMCEIIRIMICMYVLIVSLAYTHTWDSFIRVTHHWRILLWPIIEIISCMY